MAKGMKPKKSRGTAVIKAVSGKMGGYAHAHGSSAHYGVKHLKNKGMC